MNVLNKNIEAICLLLLASMFFWFPYHLKQSGIAHHKILVATENLHDRVFERTVILVLQDTGYGAFGLVLNKPPKNKKDPHIGGPVEVDSYYTLHALSVTDPGTLSMTDLQVGYTTGAAFANSVSKMREKPEYITFKGSTGWGRGQLSREIFSGDWKVINFDRDLVFHTDPQKMWDIAIKQADAG